ncbi:hypothetical protein BKA63DRAFT_307778 [Paraphoma chrysanthemicola]|nr:hypothetical protein BKA63DRAFT_307778 [Paraphoma chrysanthemicola]
MTDEGSAVVPGEEDSGTADGGDFGRMMDGGAVSTLGEGEVVTFLLKISIRSFVECDFMLNSLTFGGILFSCFSSVAGAFRSAERSGDGFDADGPTRVEDSSKTSSPIREARENCFAIAKSFANSALLAASSSSSKTLCASLGVMKETLAFPLLAVLSTSGLMKVALLLPLPFKSDSSCWLSQFVASVFLCCPGVGGKLVLLGERLLLKSIV